MRGGRGDACGDDSLLSLMLARAGLGGGLLELLLPSSPGPEVALIGAEDRAGRRTTLLATPLGTTGF